MRKIQRKYFTKKLIGGIFVVFWNLTLASTEDELMTYSNQDYGDGVQASFPKDAAIVTNETEFYRGAIPKPRLLFVDTIITSRLSFNKTERFLYLTQSEDRPWVTITVRPCYGEISWNLYFRNQKETGYVDNLKERGTQLYMYQKGREMRSHFVNNTDLGMGLYIIDITATKENGAAVEILASLWPREPALFKIADKVSDPREINIKFLFENDSLSAKFRKDYPANEFSDVRFKLLLHPRKNYNLMCAAELEENENDRNELIEQTEPEPIRNASLIFRIGNLVQGQQYYMSIYAVGSASFAVPYASTSFVYKPTKPIGLKDGVLMRVNLKDNGGRLSFKYKVSNKTTIQQGSTNILRIFVIPCGGIVLVEIKHKHVVIEHRKIREFAIFQIEKVTNRQRYTFKIIDLSLNELRKFSNVSVLATIRPKYEPLPSLPADHKLHVRYNKTEQCNGTISAVSWLPIINDEPITYCVSVHESDYEYDEDNILDSNINSQGDPFEKIIDQQRLINQCAVDWSTLYSLTSTRCFVKYCNNLGRPLLKKLKNLKPDHDYLIQVIARKYKREGAISYKLLRIRKKDICNFH